MVFLFNLSNQRSRRESNPRSSAWQADMLTPTPRDLLKQWRLTGSNRRPSACKADALPAELNLLRITKSLLVNESVTTLLMTRTWIEPVIPPWKGGVLTAWPTGLHVQTESKGFEPLRQCSPPTWFPIMLLRPLGQLSRFGSPRYSRLFFIYIDGLWYSASRTRTYDIMINSHALLPTELLRNN